MRTKDRKQIDWEVLVSQVPWFEILLKPAQLGANYTQRAATQLTTSNTSASHDLNHPESSIFAGDNGKNAKYDAWQELHQTYKTTLQAL